LRIVRIHVNTVKEDKGEIPDIGNHAVAGYVCLLQLRKARMSVSMAWKENNASVRRKSS
jgi:hypothetical protein